MRFGLQDWIRFNSMIHQYLAGGINIGRGAGGGGRVVAFDIFNVSSFIMMQLCLSCIVDFGGIRVRLLPSSV